LVGGEKDLAVVRETSGYEPQSAPPATELMALGETAGVLFQSLDAEQLGSDGLFYRFEP
jgi:hypothetical protein